MIWLTSWSDYYNKYSEHTSSHIDIKEIEKKFVFLWWDLLGFILNSFPV